uniref:Uncharacterized protein n=1 Tax=Strigamia maritima TaxID=126957 RepID=T1J3C3_STRMM
MKPKLGNINRFYLDMARHGSPRHLGVE